MFCHGSFQSIKVVVDVFTGVSSSSIYQDDMLWEGLSLRCFGCNYGLNGFMKTLIQMDLLLSFFPVSAVSNLSAISPLNHLQEQEKICQVCCGPSLMRRCLPS